MDFIKKRSDILFRGFIFVLTTLLVAYLFPREGKFRYEFQKGKPWMHEILIAPFDFPIYKSEAEIAAERDSILNGFSPYFNLDSTVWVQQLQKFREEFTRRWDNLELAEYVTEVDVSGRKSALRTIEKSKDEFNDLIISVFSSVYSAGILAEPDVLNQFSEQGNDLIILRNNYAETSTFENVLTQKKAYERLIQDATRLLDEENNLRSVDQKILVDLDLNDFISPNLFFDQQKTTQARAELLDDISLTKGMIQAGERIISRGEVVNNYNFRVLQSLKREYESQLGMSGNVYLVLLGQIILAFIFTLVVFLFLNNFRKEILQSKLKTLFIFFLLILFLFLARMTIDYSLISIYVIPFAIVPIIIKTFYDSRLALFIHIVTILIVGFWAPNSFEFVFLNYVAGIVAIFSLTNQYRRGKLFLTTVLIMITYSFVYLGLGVIQEGNFTNIEWKRLLWFGGNGLLVLTSYPLIYIFEKAFGFLSDATLMELSDTNQPLLRKLAEIAPGTFQHSMQVANLSEEAIFRIGGNPLLVRTGALYHDIGKTRNPIYFIENQSSQINPHDTLEFDESARIIINHVKDGVEIGKKHNLPEQILDFIRTHHGTTTVQYFYKSYVNKYPERTNELKKFQYPGPIPFSKETAVLMMADSVEAASRSLKSISNETIDNLVENIINHQIFQDQFINADITFKDITIIKDIFKKKLKNIYHARIEYPR